MIDWLRDDPPKVCARCARPVRLGWQQPAPEHQGKRVWVAVRRWPDGYICAGCFATACETYGRCALCRVERLVREVGEHGPIGPYRNVNARSQLRQAATFLRDLATRGVEIADCTQGDIDRWFATAGRSAKNHLRPFLTWALRRHSLSGVRLPPAAISTPTPISQDRRLALIRRVHVDESIPLQDRVVALLILLYAQPLIKIARLTDADVVLDDGDVRVRLGSGPPAPLVPPFAGVLLDYIAARSNQTTATNPASTLLFPGRRAGQPIHPGSLRLRLRRVGIPNLDSRSRAIRELVLQAPPVVVAGLLGYHPARVEVLAAEGGATWKRYAPGDHTHR